MEEKTDSNLNEKNSGLDKESKIVSSFNFEKVRFFMSLILAFAATLSITFIVTNLIKPEKITVVSQPDKSSKNIVLPKAFGNLKNSSFSNWNARVKGIVESIDRGSILIAPIEEKYLPKGQRKVYRIQGAKTRIYIVPTLTKFYSTDPKDEDAVIRIDQSAIKVGKVIEGSVRLSYQDEEYKLFGLSLAIRD